MRDEDTRRVRADPSGGSPLRYGLPERSALTGGARWPWRKTSSCSRDGPHLTGWALAWPKRGKPGGVRRKTYLSRRKGPRDYGPDEVLSTAHRKSLMRSKFDQAFVVSTDGFLWSPFGPLQPACVIDLWIAESAAVSRLWIGGPKGDQNGADPRPVPCRGRPDAFGRASLLRKALACSAAEARWRSSGWR